MDYSEPSSGDYVVVRLSDVYSAFKSAKSHHWHKNRATENIRSWTHPQNYSQLTP